MYGLPEKKAIWHVILHCWEDIGRVRRIRLIIVECKLLLLALTYRLCSIYSRRIIEEKNVAGHKIDTFIKLIRLIEKYYMQERGVAFYADKLCLSPKYLSALSKSVCGYTVQELVFRAIIRKSIF